MPMISRRWLILAAALFCCCLGAAGEVRSQSDTTSSEDQGRLKLAVIGASASAGFGIVVEVEKAAPTGTDDTVTSDAPAAPRTVKRMIKLIDLIDAADQEDRIIEFDLSSHMFFTRPLQYGRSSVDRTLSWKPDVVFAVDFLFWYVFGTQPEETRLETLEQGLAQLERLAATGASLVVGTLPDLEGVESSMITKDQIPRTETVTEANRRIERWAKKHSNVVVAPIFELNRSLSEGGAIRIGPHLWHPDRDGIELIASDKLHPTYDGLICIAQAIEVALRTLDTDESTFPSLELDQAMLRQRMRVRPQAEVAP